MYMSKQKSGPSTTNHNDTVAPTWKSNVPFLFKSYLMNDCFSCRWKWISHDEFRTSWLPDPIIDSFWLKNHLVWQNVDMCAFHIVKRSALPYMNMSCIRFNIIGAIGIWRNLGYRIHCPVTKWKMHQFVPGPPEIREHCSHPTKIWE